MLYGETHRHHHKHGVQKPHLVAAPSAQQQAREQTRCDQSIDRRPSVSRGLGIFALVAASQTDRLTDCSCVLFVSVEGGSHHTAAAQSPTLVEMSDDASHAVTVTQYDSLEAYKASAGDVICGLGNRASQNATHLYTEPLLLTDASFMVRNAGFVCLATWVLLLILAAAGSRLPAMTPRGILYSWHRARVLGISCR